MSKNDTFIKKANLKHNFLYDYSIINYINAHNKIKIICHKHGIFEQSPNAHLNGQGCPKCKGGIVYNIDDFLEKSKKIHFDEYDYSLVKYVNNNTKVNIICKTHGIFQQTPHNHYKKQGCPKCATYKISKSLMSNTLDFSKKSEIIHNNKYDYKLVDYKGNNKKVNIICKKHGIFQQTPQSHLNGSGCPKCFYKSTSIPEQIIYYYLSKIGIEIINREKIHGVEIDIYIPQLKLGIEYDGLFYHKNKEKKDLDKVLKLANNNIKLIRIRENGLNIIEKCFNILRKDNNNIFELNDIILSIIKYINFEYGLILLLEIDIKSDYFNILSLIKDKEIENSIINTHPHLVKEWNYLKNDNLRPEFFSKGSNQKIWWVCNNGHEWINSINNRLKNKEKCKKCRISKKSFSFLYSKDILSKFWDYEKNIISPDDISYGSNINIYCLDSYNNEKFIPAKQLKNIIDRYHKNNNL